MQSMNAMVAILWFVFVLGLIGIGSAARVALLFILTRRETVTIAPGPGNSCSARLPVRTWPRKIAATAVLLVIAVVYVTATINIVYVAEVVNALAREAFAPYTS